MLLTRLLCFVTKLVDAAHDVGRKVNICRREHVVFERPAPEANGNHNAHNSCPNFGDTRIRDKGPIGSSASNCAKRVEITSLENARDVAKKYVAKHTAANARNTSHQNDREGQQVIYLHIDEARA